MPENSDIGKLFHYISIYMPLREIISANHENIAFIVGNGINRYPGNPKAISWDHLLLQLWKKFSPENFEQVPQGLSMTEFYDLLDIQGSTANYAIQKEAARLLGGWSFQPHHKSFITKAREMGSPVLTTNFDMVLPASLELQQYFTDKKGFSDFYPWSTYYGDRQLNSPTSGFGIWYINGFVRYPRSIRLGLSHYMGCVERARNLMSRGLYAHKYWQGQQTWLEILLNKSLCIFGLSMEENEVFIRWLLIERAKYFKKFPERKKEGWYVMPRTETPNARSAGKALFLKSVGLHVIEVNSYDEIYRDAWV